jgi:hypothetical protein
MDTNILLEPETKQQNENQADILSLVAICSDPISNEIPNLSGLFPRVVVRHEPADVAARL